MSTQKALLIVDVQSGMFDETPPIYQGEVLIEKIKKLIMNARQEDFQIIYIQHNEKPGESLETGTPGWEIHPDISPKDEDIIIQKFTPDSFFNTSLHQQLQDKGISELIIVGIQTEICIDTTCRRAFSLGYTVTLISDAHSTWDTNTLKAKQIIEHHNNVLRWFAKVSDTNSILT
ncbi:cysteine hydrolase family protein [Cohnella sp.]|uniref:cysteine hydrolase family protein n=1 Tax=Cohnella sp. TaxID=1883426 RepID=UPI0035616041